MNCTYLPQNLHRALPLTSQYCHSISIKCLVNNKACNTLVRWYKDDNTQTIDIPYFMVHKYNDINDLLDKCYTTCCINTISYILKYKLQSSISDTSIITLCNHLRYYKGKKGIARVIQDLIDNGVNINTTDEKGNTALMYAIRYNIRDAIECLLDNSARRGEIETYINHTNNDGGDTPLIWSIIYNTFDMIQYLIERGANVNICDSHGYTTAMIAIDNINKYEIARYLCGKQNDALSLKEFVDRRNKFGDTLIMRHIPFNMIRYLVEECNADIHVLNDISNNNVLFNVICSTRCQEKLDAIKYLVERGVDIKHRDSINNTLLIYACLNFRFIDVELWKYLVNSGIDIDAVNNYNRNALLTLLLHNKDISVEIVRYLVERCSVSSLNLQDVSNLPHTPLVAALLNECYNHTADTIQCLLDAGAVPTEQFINMLAKRKHRYAEYKEIYYRLTVLCE